MTRFNAHAMPDKDALERNKQREPEGERIRQELIDFLDRNQIVSISLDTDQHCVSVDIAKLPPEIKPVLTSWGSIYVRNEPAASPAQPEKRDEVKACEVCDETEMLTVMGRNQYACPKHRAVAPQSGKEGQS